MGYGKPYVPRGSVPKPPDSGATKGGTASGSAAGSPRGAAPARAPRIAGIDERKIAEIISRVVDRLGGTGSVGGSAGGVTRAPPHGNVPAAEAAGPSRKANIPRGTNGVYPDADSAAKA